MGYTHDLTNWVRSLTMHPIPKNVLHAITARVDEALRCWPSQMTLANDTGYSERTVLKALAYLEDSGLITRQRRQNGRQRGSDLIVVIYGVMSPAVPWMEYQRMSEGGSARSKVPTYAAARMRITRTRGPAVQFECNQCERMADVWVYDGTCPEELVDSDGRRYSPDPARYEPMCWPCSRQFNTHGGQFNTHAGHIQHEHLAVEDTKEDTNQDTQDHSTSHVNLVELTREDNEFGFPRDTDLDVAKRVLDGVMNLIPELDDDALWTWYTETSSNPPHYQNHPELADKADLLLKRVHEELMKRLVNPND